MMATVYKSTGSWYVVQDEEGKVFNARIKGKFKIDMKYKVEKDGHLSINIDIEGDEDMFGYIEMTSEAGGYEDSVAMGIDSENVFEAYTYDAKELKKIGISHVKKLVKLYKENSY